MKFPVRVLLTILIGFTMLSANAQYKRVMAAEYFWDNDPGQGSGNAMVATDGSFNQEFEAISQNTATLPSVGTHKLSVRAQDSTGMWGPVFSTVVQVQAASTSLRADNIITGEYFWDNDPGQGNGTAMIAFDGSFNQAFEAVSQNTATLPAIGTHSLNVRTKDVAGNWGPLFTTVVQVLGASTTLRADNIVAGEYFWDNDPGQGSASPMVAFDGSFNQAFEAVSQNTSALPAVGTHTLNVRTKDVAGNWGPLFTTVVQVLGATTTLRADKIIAGEYFWDTDPGQGSASPMVAFDGAFDQAFEAVSQNTSALPAVGTHTLSVRTKDMVGNWGPLFTTVVQVLGASTTLRADKIIAGEYFWDTDPGQGSANAMVAFDGSFNQAFEAISQNTSAFPANGTHTLSVRAKDVAGNWGPVFTKVVQILGATTTLRADKIIAGEYFWDSDPGQGSGDAMVAFDGSFDQAFETISQSTAALPAIGLHTLNIRSKDVAGNWGSLFTVVVQIGASSNTLRPGGVIAGEYFFDADPGQGNATPMLAYGGSFGFDFQNIKGGNIPGPVIAGMHLLSLRTKDVANNWGPVFSIVVNIDTTIGAPNVSISGSSSFCSNQLASIVYSTPLVSGTVYTWSITGGTINSGAGTNSVSVTWNSSGPYKIVVTGCNSLGTLCSSDSIIPVIKPVATSTIAHTICEGQIYAGHNTNGTFIDTFTAVNGCDSIRTLNLTVIALHRATINQSICPGSSYLGYTQTGTYVDTLQGSNGCDSIRTLNLSLLPIVQTTVNQSICQGQSYGGHTANGTYIDTFQASNGCDSIRTLHLTINAYVQTTINQNICAGNSYGGHTANGTYVDTFAAQGGCDSIRTLHLTVLQPVTSIVTQSICQGQSYYGHSTNGTYVDTIPGSNGCDSIRTLHLTILTVSQTTVNQSICPGQSYGGHNATGTYIDTLQGSNSCDSIRTLHLTLLQVSRTTISPSICQGQNYYGYTSTGTYIDTLQGSNGCDSIRTLQLTVSSVIQTTVNKTICPGDSFLGHYQSGTYIDTFVAAGSCDSVRTLNLTVSTLILTNISQTICGGSSYGGHSQTGTFVDTLTSAAGCDSIRILNLTVTALARDTIHHSICQGDNYQGHTASGYYTDTLTTGGNCDSLVTLQLTVNPLPAVPIISQDGDTLIAPNAAAYQWYQNSNPMTGDTSKTIVLTQNGLYEVAVYDSNGCFNQSSTYHVTNVGITEIWNGRGLVIFPNPASNILNLQMSDVAPNEAVSFQLIDVIGQVIFEQTRSSATRGNYNTQFNLSNLAAGVYTLQIQQGSWSVSRKVVVAR